MTDSLLIDSDADGHVLTLTVNRPARRNALSLELLQQLSAALAGVDRAPNVRCVLLCGTPPAFCAGLDLDEVRGTAAQRDQLLAAYRAALQALADSRPPVLAAVAGDAAAGGAGLLLQCDIVLAAREARIGFPGLQRGLVAGVLMPDLLRAVGPQRARYLMLGAPMLPAEQAERMGLVHEVLAEPDLPDRAEWWTRRIASYPPRSVERTREWLRRSEARAEIRPDIPDLFVDPEAATE